MINKQDTFALFFPEPFDQTDHDNLLVSGVKRIQLFLGVAFNLRDQLHWLTQSGVRVTLRVEEDGYYTQAGRSEVAAKVSSCQAAMSVEAVIIGNEPESDYDLTWSSQNWGNRNDQHWPQQGGKAQAHNEAVQALAALLPRPAVKLVSPGWSHHRIVPRDAPQPGRMSWRELTLPAYSLMDANGSHLYAHNWAGPEDENRYLWSAGEDIARCHKAVWVNETNVNTGSAVERMRAVMKMYELLAVQDWARSRIESFCPFVSNGTGIGFSPGYIIRDPTAYQELGHWLVS